MVVKSVNSGLLSILRDVCSEHVMCFQQTAVFIKGNQKIGLLLGRPLQLLLIRIRTTCQLPSKIRPTVVARLVFLKTCGYYFTFSLKSCHKPRLSFCKR